MDRSWWWKLGTIIAVTLLGVWFLIPSYYSFFVLPKDQRNNLALLEKELPAWAPPASYRLNLGLDLQGGIYMVMRVDTKTALQKRVERRAVVVQRYLADRNLGEVTVEANPQQLELTLTAKDAASLDAIQKEVSASFNDFSVEGREGNALKLKLIESQATQFMTEAVDQAMVVIRRRIDKWGVGEVDVRKLGNDAIQISLPGRQDPEQAKELVGTTAQLEFRMVDDTSDFFGTVTQQNPPPPEANITVTTEDGRPALTSPSREALLAYLDGKAPADRVVMLQCIERPGSKNEKSSCERYVTYLLEKTVPLTGESIANARADIDEMNQPVVLITFDAAGGREFGELTEKGVGRRMAIILDENVQMAPVINEKIPGGSARITLGQQGGRTFEQWLGEAQMQALVLQAGALPAPVTVGEIRQVGASLGDELIRKGSLAAVVGVVLVLLFMAIYYKLSGLIADVALLINGVMLLAGLAFFNATLTLPGIAGFALTLGIAVDANVLINERIREELAAGKTARAALEQGYDRVFWTIFDSHITTLIAGFILFFTGTGPIRGFATSLIIGLIASFFTSIVVTRVIMTRIVHGRNAQTVSV